PCFAFNATKFYYTYSAWALGNTRLPAPGERRFLAGPKGHGLLAIGGSILLDFGHDQDLVTDDARRIQREQQGVKERCRMLADAGQGDIADGVDFIGATRRDKKADGRSEIANQELSGFTLAVDEANGSRGCVKTKLPRFSLQNVGDGQVAEPLEELLYGGLIGPVQHGFQHHPIRTVLLQHDPAIAADHLDQRRREIGKPQQITRGELS